MTAYKHGEAFCLMQYASKDHSVVETLWNSRDGVTPFMISTAAGDVQLQHINFGRDIRAPFHVPKVGDRIFVDLTMERAIEMRTKYVARFWFDERFQMSDRYESKAAAIRELAHADMRQGLEGMSAAELIEYGAGPPDIVVVDQERLEAIIQRMPPEQFVPRGFA